MLNFRRQVLLYIFKSFDLVLLVAALCVSVLGLALFTPLPILVAERIQVHTIFGIAVLLFLWRQTFSLLGLYQSKRPLPPCQSLPICQKHPSLPRSCSSLSVSFSEF